jgi:RNA polymerase sigma-70 factor (ECF subfamily)
MRTKRLPDKHYVHAFKKGDIKAYEELLNRYSEKVFHLSMRITRNQDDAEDVLQDVFASVYQKISMFKEQSAFSSWLYRITVNTSYMKLRVRRKHATVDLDDVVAGTQESWALKRSETDDLNYMTARHQLQSELTNAIASLPEDYQKIFILRDVDGLSNQEVSSVLEVSVPAIKSRLHRARMCLRKQLESFYRDYKEQDSIAYGPNMPNKEKLAA